MKVVVDRFEGKYAVCEKNDRTMVNIKRSKLPKELKEGDVLQIEGEIISIDLAETLKRKAEIKELTKDIWK
ncbi:DUF3006 domain-containing protein [Clostridium sp.]|jgi:hypothetical protein|uniref:DUF3006 domain-containing protein n=1 Tax=Clostridium sp. TaxID=1506 RepID=UPI002586CD67|nr:DUF3006 domain-containing protein [Clostridium sp.]MDF2503436.1 hypothetical protein [Clostridium sp.]